MDFRDLFVDETWDTDITVERLTDTDRNLFTEYGNKPKGLEPTRFGDWQYKGRATDY